MDLYFDDAVVTYVTLLMQLMFYYRRRTTSRYEVAYSIVVEFHLCIVQTQESILH